MLFDLRGRRKRFIQVIYATLAVLMGGGLVFFGIGSDVSGGLFNAFDEGSNPAGESFSDEADEIEEKLVKDPQNENLHVALVRARYSAGNNLSELDPNTGAPVITPEAEQEYEKAADAWDRYLEVTEEPSPNVATLAANAFYSLATVATTAEQQSVNFKSAAQAQKIVAEARPSAGTLSTLAFYSYAALDFKAGDKAAKQAVKAAPNKGQARSIKRELASIRKQAKAFQKQQKKAQQAQGATGAEGALQNPFGGFGGAGGGLTPAP
jgi:hypothetical protein